MYFFSPPQVWIYVARWKDWQVGEIACTRVRHFENLSIAFTCSAMWCPWLSGLMTWSLTKRSSPLWMMSLFQGKQCNDDFLKALSDHMYCSMENDFPTHSRFNQGHKCDQMIKLMFCTISHIRNEDENKGSGSEKGGNQQTAKKGWLMGGGCADWVENGDKEVEERNGWRKGGGGGRGRGGEGIRIIFHLWQRFTFQQLQRCLQKDLPPFVQGLCPCLHWALWKVLKNHQHHEQQRILMSVHACPIVVHNKPLIFVPDFRKLELKHTQIHFTGVKNYCKSHQKIVHSRKKYVINIFSPRHYYFFMKEHHLMEVHIHLQMMSSFHHNLHPWYPIWYSPGQRLCTLGGLERETVQMTFNSA